MTTFKTNREVFKQAINNLSDIDLAILRERILAVMEHTIENKDSIRESMKDGFFSPDLFISTCERVFNEFDFEK